MADRRRSGAKTRPPTAEELNTWSQTRMALTELATTQAQAPSEVVLKVNKWMANLPHDEATQVEGFESIKAVRTKLTQGLTEIKASAEAEAEKQRVALEHVKALIALRRGPDSVPLSDKRAKRARLNSPASVSVPGSPRTSSHPQLSLQSTNGVNPGHHHGLPLSASSMSSAGNGGRSSQGPQGPLRDARAKREWLASQLPLQPGRKVAFRQPQQNKGNGRAGGDSGAGDPDGETWILAVVKRSIGQDRHKYEVQDDDTEDGEPGQKYNTTLKSLIPLPDPDTAPSSPSHPKAYEEFPVGTSVLGLYPDTSCFYKAVVVAGPRDPTSRASGLGKSQLSYRLKFEDDDDYVRAVGVQWVVEAPL